MYWVGFSSADASAMFQPSEQKYVANDIALVDDACLDTVARIRDAVAANRLNALGEGIPRSLRAEAIAITRRVLLMRWGLPITEEREAAANKADDVLTAIKREKQLVLTPDGILPTGAAQLPRIKRPTRIYALGAGMTPSPTPQLPEE